MRTRTPLWMALIVTASALAGCTGGGQPSSSEDIDGVQGQAPEGTGSIRGQVLDTSQLPLSGASVGIPDDGSITTTDGEGGFEFIGLEPGAYSLAAQKIGYESAAQRVTIEADAVLEVTFELEAIAIVEPFVDVQTWTGFIECQFGTVGLSGNCLPIQNVLNQNDLPNPTNTEQIGFFDVIEPRNETVGGLYEMIWEKSTAYTGNVLSLNVETENTGLTGQGWASGSGGSPLRVPYDENEAYLHVEPGNEDNDQVQVRIFASGGAPPEFVVLQTFDVWSSVFYHANPGDVYSALPDE